MDFEILSGPVDVETIAIGNAIRELPRLKKVYGKGRWRKLKGVAEIRLGDGTPLGPKSTGMKPMASERRNSRSSGFWIDVMTARTPPSKYVLCIDNAPYPASLEVRKVYRTVPDKGAETKKLLRVVDESGQDCLFPQRLFVPVELPAKARPLFTKAS